MGYKRKVRVLFLGSGNSGRSRMAEGFARVLGGDRLEMRSAGIDAGGQDPRAIRAMAEAGIDVSGQASARLTLDLLDWADLVVTVSSHADRQCPPIPPRTQRKHWPLKDPACASGTEEELEAAYRETREAVRAHVAGMIGGLRLMDRD